LRFAAPVCLPILEDSGVDRPMLHAYSGGAVLELHQLPKFADEILKRTG